MGQILSEPVVDKTTHKDKNNNLMYAVSAMQGWRLTMEDAHATVLDLDDAGSSFFGVYDGHGGASIAQYTGQNLHRKVQESSYFGQKKYHENYCGDPSGCTAVTALLTPENKIYVANAGDSRSVISVKGKAIALSEDHKPDNGPELQRIIAAGGFVKLGRVNGNLALSRAIGDFEFKQSKHLPAERQIVTCEPDITERCITGNDEFLVLACDVVDVIREEIAKRTPLDEICEIIIELCLAPESETGGVGCDNMSIMIVAILHGKTEEEWYDWMVSRASAAKKTDALGNTTSSDSEKES
ncbi:Protein phosphatase 2C 2 [Apophysomyces ossiformis]|uniref:protein-serine/threonine phosphatase n=1 Tax=Apophysomyces ossiformis TaxID=679940 RepID=A0A8H7BZ50_9FUNG|nr:Protein phosphatase 2C 2 [Apophysomyces ossiformis]